MARLEISWSRSSEGNKNVYDYQTSIVHANGHMYVQNRNHSRQDRDK